MDLYTSLQDEFTQFDNLVDVGCGSLYDLAHFDDTPFKRLVGIDKEFTIPAYTSYQMRKRQLHGPIKSPYEFKKRFTILKQDFLTYDFQENINSLIICRNVLHFFEEKEKIIKVFYNSLQDGGLLFIRINHNRNKLIHDVNAQKIGVDAYLNMKNTDQVFYLIDSEKFSSTLSSSYRLLSKYTHENEEALTLVIKKS